LTAKKVPAGLDSLGGTIGGVLSSQYAADAAKKKADADLAAAKAKAGGATNWTQIALIGGAVLAVILVLGFVFTRKS
jgi:ethanolamine utilization microcompartment shell protein EutL